MSKNSHKSKKSEWEWEDTPELRAFRELQEKKQLKLKEPPKRPQ